MIDRERIASMLGVTRDYVRTRLEPRPDFPRPALRLSRKTVRWDEGEIARWMKTQKARA